MKKLISVTQEHIDNGLRSLCWNCPVALAAQEQTNLLYVKAGYSVIEFGASLPTQHHMKTPTRVKRFIRKFDCLGRSAVKPFRFWLEIPE